MTCTNHISNKPIIFAEKEAIILASHDPRSILTTVLKNGESVE
jgi:hypothetical protein